MKKIHQLPSGVSIQESGVSIQESGVSIQESGVSIQYSGDRRLFYLFSPHPTPHTPHPTPQLNYLICAMMIVLG
ncbi:hypothetical protein [Microcystis aeruginosa]|uniref:Uncharacterized protein n=1 Tax=Microcystis aeruginosa PCC 9808 TaxID=1160284 RepID=I4HJQ0_MICAE|nr:hypothetical protein [Microcystis aeruginosa]CCI22274.1 hypothetical protein MICAG_1700005 [Microcystis aeruginosa PCC 9808]